MTVLEGHPAVRAYWSKNQVVEWDEIDAAMSDYELERRNRMYPGLLDLMPVDRHADVDVLDFGCGPGHDTIGFLKNGANHVYAADVSWKGLAMVRQRLEAHGYLDRCTLMLVGDGDWCPPPVDHVHTAGVLHHVADPVAALAKLAGGLRGGGEIRAMVYSAESQFYRVTCGGDPETFRHASDAGAPISHAWTADEFIDIACRAHLSAEHVGSYRTVGETEGPGLMSCWRVYRC